MKRVSRGIGERRDLNWVGWKRDSEIILRLGEAGTFQIKRSAGREAKERVEGPEGWSASCIAQSTRSFSEESPRPVSGLAWL